MHVYDDPDLKKVPIRSHSVVFGKPSDRCSSVFTLWRYEDEHGKIYYHRIEAKLRVGEDQFKLMRLPDGGTMVATIWTKKLTAPSVKVHARLSKIVNATKPVHPVELLQMESDLSYEKGSTLRGKINDGRDGKSMLEKQAKVSLMKRRAPSKNRP